MAVLTTQELQELRQRMAQGFVPVTWTKGSINAALQAVIDRLELPSTQNAISGDIEAVAPGVFNGTQKRKIFVLAVLILAHKEGVF
jgi:hypothetical protein